jgi:hypothetical protein
MTSCPRSICNKTIPTQCKSRLRVYMRGESNASFDSLREIHEIGWVESVLCYHESGMVGSLTGLLLRGLDLWRSKSRV